MIFDDLESAASKHGISQYQHFEDTQAGACADLREAAEAPLREWVVVLVSFHVLGEVCDSPGQNGDLHLWRTCITLMGCIFFDNFSFYAFF
jgi:hypothetical protein